MYYNEKKDNEDEVVKGERRRGGESIRPYI